MSRSKFLEKALDHEIFSQKEEQQICSLLSEDEKIQFYINNNLRIAQGLAGKYSCKFKNKSKIDTEDLFSAACKGLVDAAKTFDSSRGAKFCTYGFIAMKREIVKFINSNVSIVRDPNAHAGSKPRSEFSLDKVMQDDGETSLHEIFSQCETAPTDNESNQDREKHFSFFSNKYLASLDSKERVIVESVHGLNRDDSMNFSEIALELNTSRQRVHQIYLKALRKLRLIMSEDGYKNFNSILS